MVLDRLTTAMQGGEEPLRILELRRKYVRSVSGQEITMRPSPFSPDFAKVMTMVQHGELPPFAPAQAPNPAPVNTPSQGATPSTKELQSPAAWSPVWNTVLSPYTYEKSPLYGRPIAPEEVPMPIGEFIQRNIPIYSTAKYWKEMPTWGKALSIIGDVATVAPGLAGGIKAVKTGTMGPVVRGAIEGATGVNPNESLSGRILSNAKKTVQEGFPAKLQALQKSRDISQSITAPQGLKTTLSNAGIETAHTGVPITIKGYHGTDQAFDVFDPTKLGSNTKARSAREAFFFAGDKKVANMFANSGVWTKAHPELDAVLDELSSLEFVPNVWANPKMTARMAQLRDLISKKRQELINDPIGKRVIERDITLNNPYVIDLQGQVFHKWKNDIGDFAQNLKYAKANGYDGVIYKNAREAIEGTPTTNVAVFSTQSITTPKLNVMTEAAGAQTAGTGVQTGQKAIDRIIAQATAQVAQDKPGLITNTLSKIPGVKQAMQYERPGLKMQGASQYTVAGKPVVGRDKSFLNVAMVAENSTRTDVAQQLVISRNPLINQLKQVFGKDIVNGKARSSIPFIGTAEQAKHPITGALKDIVENPELYQLNDAQKAAIQAINAHGDDGLKYINEGFNAGVGRFPTKPGAAFLSNIESKADDAIKYVESEYKRTVSGRGKTRYYETARDRMNSDPTFKPELDVQKILEAQDNFKASVASGQTFKQVTGGLTKLEVMEKTHPDLYGKMINLRKRLATLRSSKSNLAETQVDAIDSFMKSGMDDEELAALLTGLSGKSPGVVSREIQGIRSQISALQPRWKTAHPKPFERVDEGGLYRYFPSEEASLIRQSRKAPTGVALSVLSVLDNIRGTAFSGDLSPILGIQVPIGMLAHPQTAFPNLMKQLFKGISEKEPLRMFSRDALVKDMAADPTWKEFSSLTGHAVGVPQEFSGGYLAKLPQFRKFNESTFVIVTRQQKALWDNVTQTMIKSGVPEQEAKIAAAELSTRVYPMLNTARLGQSVETASIFRALPTSISYIRKPGEMIAEATRAYVKLATKQTLTPREKMSALIMTQMAASTLAVSAATHALDAQIKGEDPFKAALKAINPYPYNGHFASLKVPGTSMYIPIGGPYRAIFRAVYPGPVEGSPVPIPFAGLPNYLQNRMNPAIRTQLDIFANKDFYGNKIKRGEFLENTLRGLAYELEGMLPLTVGAGVEAGRTGITAPEAAQQVIGQFVGVNINSDESLSKRLQARQDELFKAKTGLTEREYIDKYGFAAAKKNVYTKAPYAKDKERKTLQKELVRRRGGTWTDYESLYPAEEEKAATPTAPAVTPKATPARTANPAQVRTREQAEAFCKKSVPGYSERDIEYWMYH